MAYNYPSANIAGHGISITTVEMHCGNQNLRVVTEGFPKLKGATLVEKMADLNKNHDHLRRMLMQEPRGHSNKFGALLVEPNLPQADVAVFFISSEGIYTPMCGFGSMSVARFMVDNVIDSSRKISPATEVFIQPPCGVVKVLVDVSEDGKTGKSRLTSVPSFCHALDVPLILADIGQIKVDIGFGGSFYIVATDQSCGIDLYTTPVDDIVKMGEQIQNEFKNQHDQPEHPENADISFIYGMIFRSARDMNKLDAPRKNVMVYGSSIDRSPCGSGSIARMTVDYERGLVKLNQTVVSQSITGGEFDVRVVEESEKYNRKMLLVQLTAQSYYTGKAQWSFEDTDPVKHGFVVD